MSHQVLPSVHTQYAVFDGMRLKSGLDLEQFTLAYTTHGKLNKKKDNAILVFHALSGGSHCYGKLAREASDPALNPQQYLQKHNQFREPSNGWWDAVIGPGKAFDPEQYFLVCANMLGGCYGSTGPCSINPQTGDRYGNSFPGITIKDIATSNKMLLDSLGVERLFAVTGGSFGGFGVLEWALLFPGHAELHIPIATCARTQNVFFMRNGLETYAITKDPNFNGGSYYEQEWPSRWPTDGLKLARMHAHGHYINFDEKEVANRIVPNNIAVDPYEVRNKWESFFHAEGNKFVERFDANSYLRILGAWNEFNLREEHGMLSLPELFAKTEGQFLTLGMQPDYCFLEEYAREIHKSLDKAGKRSSYKAIETKKGHDAFLIEQELMNDALKPAIERAYAEYTKK